jgi:Cd2+/Zn2+-exporting ATPase
MPECRIRVIGLDCQVEAQAISAALHNYPGVTNLTFDLLDGVVCVQGDAASSDPLALVSAIEKSAGMHAQLLDPAVGAAKASTATPHAPRSLLTDSTITICAFLLIATAQCVRWLGNWPWLTDACYALAILLCGIELVPRAWLGLRQLRLDIHVLMTVAVAGALALGQWDEGATVAFLFVLSEVIEKRTLERARSAVRTLLDVAPETAELIRPDQSIEVVPAATLVPGQKVRVRSGQRLPVDGMILDGRSEIDQKMITGESIPVLRGPGESVFAGTINGDGALTVQATSRLSDAVVSRIAERVRQAQRGRTPIERAIDRFSLVYTPCVMLLALVVMLLPPLLLPDASWRWWIHQGLVILVIACPCALVISTPVAIVSALAVAARHGVLIKSGQFLEALGGLRVLAFDKTGTLTKGEPDVVEVVPRDGQRGEELVRIAAALGDQGGHVIGRAIARHARHLELDIPDAHDYQAVPGRGARAFVNSTQYHMGSHRYLDESGLCSPEFHASFGLAEQGVGTSVAVSSGEEPLGWLRLADRARPEAASALAELAELGVATVMLTGDNRATADAVAHELGILERSAELLPEEKAAAIAKLTSERGATGMVGDGVNDAPALASARVSIAMGAIGSGVAIETADVVLMRDDLRLLPWLVKLSRRTLVIIKTNMALAIGAKLIFMALAICGLATLWMAIAADMGVSLLVVANALRLLKAH